MELGQAACVSTISGARSKLPARRGCPLPVRKTCLRTSSARRSGDRWLAPLAGTTRPARHGFGLVLTWRDGRRSSRSPPRCPEWKPRTWKSPWATTASRSGAQRQLSERKEERLSPDGDLQRLVPPDHPAAGRGQRRRRGRPCRNGQLTVTIPRARPGEAVKSKSRSSDRAAATDRRNMRKAALGRHERDRQEIGTPSVGAVSSGCYRHPISWPRRSFTRCET